MTDVDNNAPGGAIAAAMRAIEGLHGRDHGDALDFEIMLRTGLDTWGRTDITRAFMVLIGVAFDVIRTPAEQPELRHRIVGAAVNQLHRLELDEVPDVALPTAAGGLTEIAYAEGLIGVRDSKDPNGPVLTFNQREWDAFTTGIRDGSLTPEG